jgi:hypothetical protein
MGWPSRSHFGTPPFTTPTVMTDDQSLRNEALDRLKRKRDFRHHVLRLRPRHHVAVGHLGRHRSGFPWPIFPMLGSGLRLVFHGFDTYRRPLHEEDVQAEMRRLRQG